MPELSTGDPSFLQDNDGISKVAIGTLDKSTPPEIRPFDISFSDYKEEKCTLQNINPKSAQATIKIIKDIGIDFKGSSTFQSKYGGARLSIKPVVNSAPYDGFYKKLPSEIIYNQEVKEIVFVDDRKNKEAKVRIFFYVVSKIFYILAIQADSHENLDHMPYQKRDEYKNRRDRRSYRGQQGKRGW